MDKQKMDESPKQPKEKPKVEIKPDPKLISHVQEDVKPDPKLKSLNTFEEKEENLHKFKDE